MDILQFLHKDDILLRIPAKGIRSALSRISGHLEERTGKSQEEILAALIAREALGPTGIGRGVAVPHGRLERLSAPAAILATLERPVSYEAPDLVPVDLLLVLIWPKSSMAGSLSALTHFCRLLRQSELRDRLRSSKDPAEAHAWLKLCERRTLTGLERTGEEPLSIRDPRREALSCSIPEP
ncbi:PTS IIA-like nitrogen-regulatory protein PtsN [Agaricicola taiwanensis]|uniref:PTS IIA-like nitrogen-regulatory protein PtsN n=1 Tax=Agaricicola taiwanensis TaxID=591372 RepID=A0A8J2YJ65_9RHOB|nr:PTS sugar transporter subunit IIA [Agaricicola taiwanensis]GGE46133.1 PTS IIA-like nitrogen-regulatory protein PtsN [Agaricicola taiwanensis]